MNLPKYLVEITSRERERKRGKLKGKFTGKEGDVVRCKRKNKVVIIIIIFEILLFIYLFICLCWGVLGLILIVGLKWVILKESRSSLRN